jgi:hypothetical protein
MAAEPKSLAARMLARREFWVELDEPRDGQPAAGRRVKLRRPAESKILSMRHGVTLADVQDAAVDWAGITEADLLGPQHGASDPVPFDADAWRVWIADSVAMAGRCAARMNEVITDHIKQLGELRGN